MKTLIQLFALLPVAALAISTTAIATPVESLPASTTASDLIAPQPPKPVQVIGTTPPEVNETRDRLQQVADEINATRKVDVPQTETPTQLPIVSFPIP